jgi:hypothetical protein
MTVQTLQNDQNNRDENDKLERKKAIFKIWLGQADFDRTFYNRIL